MRFCTAVGRDGPSRFASSLGFAAEVVTESNSQNCPRAEGPLGNLSVKSDTQLRLGAILRKRRDLGRLPGRSFMCPRQAQGSAASSLGNSTVATDTKEDHGPACTATRGTWHSIEDDTGTGLRRGKLSGQRKAHRQDRRDHWW